MDVQLCLFLTLALDVSLTPQPPGHRVKNPR